MPIVLVTDGEHRAALAITRSLGRAGYRVIVASPRKRSIAGASRWADTRLVTPDPLEDPAGFISSIRSLVKQYAVDILLPVTDQSLVPILSANGFERVIIPFPDLHTWGRVADKAEVLAVAGRLGIKVPHQLVLESAADRPLEDLEYPVVIKPSRSLAIRADQRLKLTVRYAHDRRQLDQTLKLLPNAAWPVLVQRRVSGPGIGVFLLLKEGALLAQFAHRRILEKPPWGGVSVCSEAIPAHPSLLEQSVELVRSFGWNGVAMVEYKLDRHTGDPYLMEVNGRFWGSLQLAIDSGVDFPLLLVEAATGHDVTPVLSWKSGVRLRWRLGELDHLIARLRPSALLPHRSSELPSLGSAMCHAVLPAWHPRSRGEVFRLDDPRPGLVELAGWLRGR